MLLRAGPFLRIPPFSPGFGIHHINEARAEADMDGLFRLHRMTREVTGPVFLLFMRWWAFLASQHWSMGERNSFTAGVEFEVGNSDVVTLRHCSSERVFK